MDNSGKFQLVWPYLEDSCLTLGISSVWDDQLEAGPTAGSAGGGGVAGGWASLPGDTRHKFEDDRRLMNIFVAGMPPSELAQYQKEVLEAQRRRRTGAA